MQQLLDSNIIIYASQPENDFLINLIEKNSPFVSIISKVEVLGYHKLKATDKKLLEFFFEDAPLIWLNEEITDKAIHLRQSKNISLADSLIAATALINNLELVTRNTSDFTGIPKLKLHNPF